MLAAAPTTPPCFRRWRRSSSLHFGHQEWKEYFVLQFRNACGRFGTAFLWERLRWKASQAHIRLQPFFCAPKGCARAFLGLFRAIRCISGAIHAELLHFCRRSWYTTGTEQYSVQYAIPIIPIEQKTVRQPQAGRFSVFCGCARRAGSFQRICGAIHVQNRPKRAKRGTLGTTKSARLGRALEKERILCKNGSSAWFWR